MSTESTLSLEDECEIFCRIVEWIDEYITENALVMSNPQFRETMTETIIYEFSQEWDDCIDLDTEEMEELIDMCIDEYFDMYDYLPEIVPPTRSRRSAAIIREIPDLVHIEKQIAYLQAIEQPKQRTKEWYEFRNELLSASNVWKVFSTDSQRNSLIFEKCKPMETGDANANANANANGYVNVKSPLHWGQKYEPVSIMIYESQYNTRVADFGCIRHPTYSFIGASPDGINVDPISDRYGRMIEVKNVVARELNGIPLEAYWIQMQLQMETCDLDECDFIETQFKEYDEEDRFYADKIYDYKGVILYFVSKGSNLGLNMNAPHYEYMPMSIEPIKECVDEWIEETRKQLRNEYALYTTIFWYLEDYSCITVQRNRQWFAAGVDQIRETWNTILAERVSGYEHRASKKRSQVEVISTHMGTSQYIKNMPVIKMGCLIKLDHETSIDVDTNLVYENVIMDQDQDQEQDQDESIRENDLNGL